MSSCKPHHGTRNMYCRHGCRCDECREANSAYIKTYHQRPSHKSYMNGYRQRKARRYSEYKMSLGGCVSCGYNKSPAALDFHHPDGDGKSSGVGPMMYGNWEALMYEIQKCSLLCANCHRELHQDERDCANE